MKDDRWSIGKRVPFDRRMRLVEEGGRVETRNRGTREMW